MKLIIQALLLLALTIPFIGLSQNITPPLSDLDTLYQTLIQKHPKLIGGKAREQFDSLYKKIRSKYSSYTRNQRIFKMTELVASMHDGHSAMGIRYDTAYHFHELPVNLYVFQDGIFIRRAAEPYGKYAGMKVLKIGTLPVDTVVKRLLPLIHGENASAVKDILPSRLIIPELLQYIGAITSTDVVPYLLEDSMKVQYTVILKTVSFNENLKWVSAQNSTTPMPLYLQNTDKNYWYAYIDSIQLFYFHFSAVKDMDDISFEKFVEQMFKKIDSLPIRKMVIDIRRNNGGDNTLNKPLIHALIRSDKVNQKGKLFVIIGRNTFSAAVNLATDLENHTNAVFVGEPTAAGPNHFGETTVFHLPVSKLLVLHSSLFWQFSSPKDKRNSIEPGVPINLTWRDYKNNLDPCLLAVIKLK
ncbi:MAG: hypothetical protein ABI666_02300 [Ferruginibacter sp.]